MRLMKRWGVMTLVALLVLGTMGAALATDVETEAAETETETAKAPLEEGSFAPAIEWADGLVQFVFYWGYDDEDGELGEGPECPAPAAGDSTGTFGLFGSNAPAEVDCEFLNVEKNGHVNHGSMVSSFVHWLKGDNLEKLLVELEDEDRDFVQDLRDMPKGQLVKMLAHLEFGKGFSEIPDLSGILDETSFKADESDDHGPPEWAMNKKDKKAEKAAKGKNK